MAQKCNLCKLDKPLENSHIIPKFIFKWLKKSGTGFFRSGENFNVRVQDRISLPFLCATCEDLFGDLETYFSNKIFYPVVQEDIESFDYDERLIRFLISVLWRNMEHALLDEFENEHHYQKLQEINSYWAQYLLNPKSKYNSQAPVHLLCGVSEPRHPDGDELDLPHRLIQYFSRGIDVGISGTDIYCMIFLKLPRFLVIVPVSGFSETDFENTLIYPGKGFFEISDAGILNPFIGDFFLNRVKAINDLFDNISPVQKKKLAQMRNEKWEDIKDKDLGRIIDYEQRFLNNNQ